MQLCKFPQLVILYKKCQNRIVLQKYAQTYSSDMIATPEKILSCSSIRTSDPRFWARRKVKTHKQINKAWWRSMDPQMWGFLCQWKDPSKPAASRKFCTRAFLIGYQSNKPKDSLPKMKMGNLKQDGRSLFSDSDAVQGGWKHRNFNFPCRWGMKRVPSGSAKCGDFSVLSLDRNEPSKPKSSSL